MSKRARISIILITALLIVILQYLIFSHHRAEKELATTIVKEHLSAQAISLTKIVETQFSALHSMVAFINIVGFDADRDIIMTYLQDMYKRIPEAKNLFLSPRGTIEHIYPIEGNEQIIGLSFLMPNSPLASEISIWRSIASRDIVVDGPREALQGGFSLIARHAIFDGDTFQGFATIVLDMEKVIERADLAQFLASNPTFAVRNVDGDVWFGNKDTFSKPNINIQVPLRSTTWELAATIGPNILVGIWRATIMFEILGMLVILLVAYILWNQKTFNTHLENVVQLRTADLQRLNDNLLQVEVELRKQNDKLEQRTLALEVSEQKYEILAYLDSLTGISNRLHLTETLSQLLLNKTNTNAGIALFFFDLNQFKEVNDTLGHTAGDRLLFAVADRIKNSGIAYRLFSRTGGDEFVLLFDSIHDHDAAEAMAERILHAFTHPFQVQDLTIPISCSIGISICPLDATTPDELLKHADLAMYEAKLHGGNHYQLFEQRMLQQLLDKTELEQELAQAITNNELVLHYQPIIDSHTKRIVSLEALVRWHHPTKGLISPAQFIPLAEETGLIHPLTDWVLAEACAQHQRWVRQGLPPVKISVNFSGVWFMKKDREHDFYHTLHQYDVSTQYIEVEITERVVFEEEYFPILARMKADGVTITIDDFGIEFSSLSYLKRFPVNKIKIDKGFTHGIGKNLVDETIVKAMVFVAYQLNYEIVAEGVETEKQAEFLKNHGCRYLQGYLFYRPMPAQDLEPILREQFIGV